MDTALLAFDVDGLHRGRLIRVFDAMMWMEALDAALGQLCVQYGSTTSCFAVKESQSAPTPHELLLMPIAHDARHARVDQILIHAPRGFDQVSLKALERIRQVERKGEPPAMIVLIETGRKSGFRDKVEHFGKSKVWQSTTPPIWHGDWRSHGLDGLEQQVAAELDVHGLPPCIGIELAFDRGRFMSLAAFKDLLAAKGTDLAKVLPQDGADVEVSPEKPTPDTPVFGMRLRFESAVQGPMALGRCARHGMGQFLPNHLG